VQRAREALQRRLEAQPMDFLLRQMPPLFIAARSKLAAFVGAEPADLVFVDNATIGMNVVAASVDLRPGDEVLANDHEYGAVLRLWERKCQTAGATLIVQRLPSPLRSAAELVESLFAAASPRTRLLVFSHVTSPTALIFPAAEICRQARQRGVLSCIDGPHAVAMLPLNLRALDCDFYTASCHKWLSAPFGSGFLYVHPRRQEDVQPAIVSWGRTLEGDEPSWRDEFHWLGTRDTTGWLAVPTAIEFLESVGLDEFRRCTHELAHYARQRIEELTAKTAGAGAAKQLEPLAPDDLAWYGSMVAVPLPAGECEPLQRTLWEKHGIEAPLIDWNGRRLIRVSCHLYNTPTDVDRLVEALAKEM
jgi:isopenicillin-N epimerase